MHADVERFSFDPANRFLRVLQQQGRVALAADGNEQAAVLLEYMRLLARHVIGPFGTPADELDDKKPGRGFLVEVVAGGGSGPNRLALGAGHYWVDGLPCHNPADAFYDAQPEHPEPAPLSPGKVLVYLDAWERHVTAVQEEALRDPALGGPDTCTRSQLVWQVKALEVQGAPSKPGGIARRWHDEWRVALDPPDRGLLAVDVDRDTTPPDPCQVPPGAGYFGNENQLYRVEVHDGSDADGKPSFVWSRDNGSVVHPLAGVEGNVAVLRDPPLDCRKQLATGTLVEVVDDTSSLLGRPGVLARVREVDDDGDDVVVHLSVGVPKAIGPERHPLLRRWDLPDTGGEEPVAIVDDGATWIPLEDGIRVRFAPAPAGGAHRYRTGDYWTFPARAVTGDVMWPRDAAGEARAVPPHGIDHSFAPLAVVEVDAGGSPTAVVVDCRPRFPRSAVFG